MQHSRCIVTPALHCVPPPPRPVIASPLAPAKAKQPFKPSTAHTQPTKPQHLSVMRPYSSPLSSQGEGPGVRFHPPVSATPSRTFRLHSCSLYLCVHMSTMRPSLISRQGRALHAT